MPEVHLIDQLEVLLETARAFIIGRPVLFVMVSGLTVAIVSVLGETLMYWVARLGGRPLVERVTRRFRMDTRHMERAVGLFSRWGVMLVLFGRILPGVRTMVSVPAGITRMNFALFFGASFGGAYLWNTLLVAVGYLLGFNVKLLGVSFL